MAQLTLSYARAAHAERGHLTESAGAIAVAACQAAHAVMAERKQWVTNEKTLLDCAGLRSVDGILAGLTPQPQALTHAFDETTALLRQAVATS